MKNFFQSPNTAIIKAGFGDFLFGGNMYFYFALSAVFNAAISLLLGIFIFSKNTKSEINRSFAYFCIAVAAWSSFYIGWPLSKTAQETLLWFQLLHIGAAFTPITYFHFVVNWLGEHRQKKKFIYLGYFLAFFFSAFVFSHYFITDMVPKFGIKFWANPGILYHFYLLFFFSYVVFSSVLLYLNLKKTSGVKKHQIKLLLVGIALSFIGGSTNYFLWYDLNIPPYGNILAGSFVIFTAYAIIKYRFMDIRIVARKSFIYLSSALFAFFFMSLTIWFFESFLSAVSQLAVYLAIAIFALVFTSSFYFIESFLKNIANNYFFAGLYNYQETIKKLSKELTYNNNLAEIVESTIGTIKETMRLDQAAVLLIDRSRKVPVFKAIKLIGFNKKQSINLFKDVSLIRYLEKSRSPLVTDELLFLTNDKLKKSEKSSLEIFYNGMRFIKASICLPLINKGRLIGVILLGSKISESSYTREDLELLSTLSDQAGIAINNAELYKQVQDFNQVLKTKVDEQTKQLRKKAKELEEKNENLNKLLRIKNEFLRIINHQINTPLSIIKNSLFMVRNKSFTVEKGLSFVDEGVRRMEQVFNEFWKAFSFEGEGIKMNFSKIDISKTIEKIVTDALVMNSFKAKNIYIKIEKKSNLVAVKSDLTQVSQVISNLLENAITYTAKGGIKIKMEKIPGFIKTSISDTGLGIEKKDFPSLFEKFYRTDRAKKSRPGGSGLGLYIAKKIIEANGGLLKLEKSEVGKGSTFSFTLPIWKAGR